MTALEASYAVFAVAAVICFVTFDVRKAALIVWLGGWALLPAAHYPNPPPASGFPYWIIGGALPSDLMIQKSWIAPCAALNLACIKGWNEIRGFRPGLIDVPVALWCLWPLAQGFSGFTDPTPLASSLFLAGSWGAPWLLGRTLFSDSEGRILLLKWFVLSGLLLIPLALIEQVTGPILYELLYQRHPFTTDGAVRYFGFRPILLFEHGNQYGIFICLTALAAGWLALMTRSKRRAAAAVLLCLVSLAAQSAGAIFLLLAGGAALFVDWQGRALRRIMLIGSGAIALLGGVYLSGLLPLDYIARSTPVGQQLLNMVRATGRGSFAWRISQDQKALGLISQKPVQGHGRWDWWRPTNSRPWGLVMLIVGQFGLLGLLLALFSPVVAGFRALLSSRSATRFTAIGANAALGLIVLLAMIDALLNAFILLPMLVFAGAIARSRNGDRDERA